MFRSGPAWLLVLLLVPAGLPAQPSDVSFQHYTTDQGLSNDLITAILKDRSGFMWFGTVNGLNRFDGLRFTVYRRTGRPDGLPGNYVVNDGIVQDRDGFLWISTNRGLARYDPRTDRFQTFRLPQQRDQVADNDFVSPVRFDRAGHGWFSSVANLYRLESRTGQLTTFPLPAIRAGSFAIPLPDRRAHLWVQQGRAVYQFDPTTRRYAHVLGKDDAHPDDPLLVETLTESRSGQLYALTTGKGLLRYNPVTKRFQKQFDFPDAITSLAEDQLPDGRSMLWLGGHNRVLTYLPSEKHSTQFTRIVNDPLSFSGGTVGTIWADAQTGVVWMGTSAGLTKVDPVAHKFGRKWLKPGAADTPEPVNVVRQDNQHDPIYWVLGRQTLYRWDRRTGVLQSIPNEPRQRGPVYYDMIQDGQGRVWIGTENGLAVYDPNTGQWQIRPNLSPTDRAGQQTVQTLCQTLDGRIWLGTTASGLYWVDPATDQIQRWIASPVDRFPNSVGQLQIDPFGYIWAQTRAGLFRLNPRTGRSVRIQIHGAAAPVQPSDQLHGTFLVTDEGKVWVSGIDFLVQTDTSGRVQQTYTLANGLLADHVFSIIEDRRGHIWLTSDNQLHELDPKTGQFHYYSTANGLFGNILFKPISIDRQGSLFTGAFGGINYWQPEYLRQNNVPPPVVITQVRVNNKPRLVRTPIQLQPGETTLTIEFSALSFSQPEANRYAYQLVGFDTDWIPTDDRMATYTNLEPGQYTFRVKAANNDGVWNETGATLALRVIPPYWKTDWFRLLVGLITVGILYAIYWYRQQQRQRLQQIRDRIATDLHDDMGSTLSSIRIFSDVVQQQIALTTPEAVPILQRISTSATTLSESMQDIIWTIQTKNDRLADVVTRMREFGLKMAEAKGIGFHMRVSDQFEKTRLHVEQRRNLYLIFKESINNAVKYAHPSRIDVDLTITTSKQLHLTIRDDGQGFNPETVQPGNGLLNLHKRAREIRGKLMLTAAPGAGTKIDLLTRL